MRKIAVALLAVPVIVLIYLPVVLRRSVAGRLGLLLGVGAIIWIAAFSSFSLSPTSATPPSIAGSVPVAQFTSDIRYRQDLHDPVAVTFGAAMDRSSVAAALSVSPVTAVSVSWSADSTRVTVTPMAAWLTGTYYTISVGVGARTAKGQSLLEPARTAFLTRPATSARLAADVTAGSRVSPASALSVAFERPVDVASAEAAFRIEPAVAGTFGEAAGVTADRVTFVPSPALAPDTAYTVSLTSEVLDTDGAPVAIPLPLRIRTAVAPSVVRFRPMNGATAIPVDAAVSVRFTKPMERTSTAAAFTVTAGGAPVTGKVTWAESDTVLVLDPAKSLGSATAVQVSVGNTAKGRDGAPIAAAGGAIFQTVGKPAPAAARPVAARAVPISRPSGSTAGRATWYAVETYYLRLMNCTRTGGWVTSTGACSSPGGLSTPPIVLDSGISSRVSRPYAKLLATRGICSHYADGNPTTRLNRAGYGGWAAENIGCRSASNAYSSVLGTHLFYQTEKPCGGYCHYANLMNPAYRRCGIGVWVYGGRIRLVVDFYHP